MNGHPRRPRRRRMQKPGKTPVQLVQLCVSLMILIAVFCMKLAFPERTSEVMRRMIGTGIDLEQSITSIGAGLREVFSPVRPQSSPEPHGSLPPSHSSEPVPSVTPEPSQEPSREPESTEETPGTTGVSPSLTMDEILLEAASQPVIALSGGEWVIDREEDDTPPVPFGMTVPEKVDYSSRSISFDHASPLTAEFSSGFGYRTHPIDLVMKFHYGLDIKGKTGTPVRSFADGRVSVVGKNASYGNYVFVEHKDGYATLYAHLSAVSVKKNAKVKLGDIVGKVGQTGKATGPHLHFELRKDGKFMDPARFISQEA